MASSGSPRAQSPASLSTRDALHWLAVALADERDRRAALYRQVSDALLTGDPARIIDVDDEPDPDTL